MRGQNPAATPPRPPQSLVGHDRRSRLEVEELVERPAADLRRCDREGDVGRRVAKPESPSFGILLRPAATRRTVPNI
jgi:hypothetical protein